MRWHLMEGEAGCEFAVAHGHVAVVVDALRASSTAAQLLAEGAREILVVRTVEEALAARKDWPDALLYGERGGLPPAGFDFGNSPLEAVHARDRRVIFSTTTGAGRMVSAWGAAAVYLGAVINAKAVVAQARSHGRDVVLIPAGLAGDPDFDAREDWVGAAAIAMAVGEGLLLGEGAAAYAYWYSRIDDEGITHLFSTAPHAEKLRAVGMEADITYCAQADICSSVPVGVARNALGVLTRSAIC